MKASEVREMTDEELLAKEGELREACFNLRVQKATGDLVNTALLKLTRRDLARILTAIRERNITQKNIKDKGPEKKRER
jgi:large subunit ribosomal protein L29